MLLDVLRRLDLPLIHAFVGAAVLDERHLLDLAARRVGEEADGQEQVKHGCIPRTVSPVAARQGAGLRPCVAARAPAKYHRMPLDGLPSCAIDEAAVRFPRGAKLPFS